MKQSGNRTIAMLTEMGAMIVAIASAATILIKKREDINEDINEVPI